MTTALSEANQWEQSSANKHEFTVGLKSGVLQVSALEGQVEFSIVIPQDYPSDTILVATSEDEDLQDYLDDINGTKATTVPDFLTHATKKLLSHFEVEEADDDDDDEESEDDDNFDDVYMEMPNVAEIKKKQQAKKVVTQDDIEFEQYAEQFKHSTGTATDRLMKELRIMYSINKDRSYGFTAEPVDDNLYFWHVKLYFDPKEKEPIAADLQQYKKKFGQNHVLLEMKFQNDYPFSPPFIRVVKPRFKFHTGHVTIGGSICMELLTSSGWAPTNDVEGILVQIRTEMLAGGARIDFSNLSEYTEYEAKSAFMRVAKRYGWE